LRGDVSLGRFLELSLAVFEGEALQVCGDQCTVERRQRHVGVGRHALHLVAQVGRQFGHREQQAFAFRDWPGRGREEQVRERRALDPR
jgi:hypothetical protein